MYTSTLLSPSLPFPFVVSDLPPPSGQEKREWGKSRWRGGVQEARAHCLSSLWQQNMCGVCVAVNQRIKKKHEVRVAERGKVWHQYLSVHLTTSSLACVCVCGSSQKSYALKRYTQFSIQSYKGESEFFWGWNLVRSSCIFFWCVKSQHERTDWFMVMPGLYLMISILSSYVASFLAIATRSGLPYEKIIVLVRDAG